MPHIKSLLLFVLACGICAALFLRFAGAQAPQSVPNSSARPQMVVQLGHSEFVSSADFSRDGRFVLTGSEDGTAILWEANSGREIRRFRNPGGKRISAVFSPDGRFILTYLTSALIESRPPHEALLWDAATGKLVRRFEQAAPVLDAEFSPDGQHVLTVSGGYVHIWETQGKEIQQIAQVKARILSAAYSPDGNFILTVDFAAARLWDLKTGSEIQHFARQGDMVHSAVFSPDGRYIVTACISNSLARLWETKSGLELQDFPHESSVETVCFSPDNRYLLTTCEIIGITSDKSAHLWEIATGKEIRRFQHPDPAASAVFSPDGRSVLTSSVDEVARLWDTASGKPIKQFAGASLLTSKALFTLDGRSILTENPSSACLWDLNSGRESRRSERATVVNAGARSALLTMNHGVMTFQELTSLKTIATLRGVDQEFNMAAISPDGRYALIVRGFYVTDSGALRGDDVCAIWDTRTGKMALQMKGHTENLVSAVFSKDSQSLLTADDEGGQLWKLSTGVVTRRFPGSPALFSPDNQTVLTVDEQTIHLWETASGHEIRTLKGHGDRVLFANFTADGQFVLSTSSDKTLRLWETRSGKEVRRLNLDTDTSFASLSQNGQFLVTTNTEGTAYLWEMKTGKRLCSLINFADGNWAVVDAEGRFDASSLEELKGLSWIMQDSPMKPLGPEVFLRQYYTPRLLTRLLAGEPLPPVPDISLLNRAQPEVRIMEVRPAPGQTDILQVTLEAGSMAEEFVERGRTVTKRSGVYDLRLFRDGQLVGWLPQQGSEVRTDPQTGRVRHAFTVPLPHDPQRNKIEFSAYAFNTDRVKSATARFTYNLPAPLPARKGRAYLISLGANSYQSPLLHRLAFAANDARLLQQDLGDRLEKSGQFTRVVRVPLLSDDFRANGKTVSERSATKANLKAALDLLAGRPVTSAQRRSLPQADQLLKATPDDVVILTFACHGDADSKGGFYLFAYDIGADARSSNAELYRHGISDTELSEWLRAVDAGQTAMIVDACHSAASVENGEFKPGPMGSPGLGQLAYDKGMQILAASQADDVAVESDKLNQGLLTYALARDGLESKQADWRPKDRRIDLAEWLGYGEQRVPVLYEEVKAGKVQAFGRGLGARSRPVIPENIRLKKRRFQQPSLFDFTRNRAPLLLDSLTR